MCMMSRSRVKVPIIELDNVIYIKDLRLWFEVNA